ncbi:hypothetical protein [Pseudomonas sp. B16(2017)]|uniref:hypothetical protein n=2 Tax=Pseudomonas TaxID=286 RepID=UPI000A1D6297|nr:hypothetical protein [Pseudomonas sp. B16(2017)]
MRARLWIAVAAVPILGGCSFARQMAESSVSYYSWDHFTLVATVPAKFGFTSKAHYYPKAGESCLKYSPGLGGMVTREQQMSNNTVAKNVAQTVSTKIPLEFHIADCSMELGGVIYEVNATYGPDAWDHGLAVAGGLSVSEAPPSVVETPVPDLIEQRRLCAWMFQISKSKAKLDEIEKLLSCKAADERWSVSKKKYEKRNPGGSFARSQLVGKTVKVDFRLSTEEYPSVGDTWLRFPEGWKPCLGDGLNDPYGFCTKNNRNFRTFKMNKRECTIYPNCVEQGVVHD